MTTTDNGPQAANPNTEFDSAPSSIPRATATGSDSIQSNIQLLDGSTAEFAELAKQHVDGVSYLRAALRLICQQQQTLGFGMSGRLQADTLADFARVESLSATEAADLKRLIGTQTQACHGESGTFSSGPHTVGRYQVLLTLIGVRSSRAYDLNAVFGFATLHVVGLQHETQATKLRAAIADAVQHIPLSDQERTATSDQHAELERTTRVAKYGSTREFAFALVSSLARRYGCQQVAMGICRGKRIQIQAVSGLDAFKESSPGIVDIQQAMEETLDARQIIVYQSHGQSSTTKAMPVHAQWGKSTRAAVASIPLQAEGDCVAVISFRRDPSVGFSDSELSEFEQALAPFAPAVELSVRGERSLGQHLLAAGRHVFQQLLRPQTWIGKLGRVAALVVMLVFLFGWLPYRPLTPCVVVPANLIHCLAAFDMQLEQALVSSGERVSAGQTLAVFDTRELELERARLLSELRQAEVDVRAALVEHDVARAALAKTNSTVAQKKLEAVNNKIELCTVVAPQDGMVVDADLSRKLGQVFAQGTPILTFAPMNAFELEIRVPEYQARHIRPHQVGTFASAALPSKKMPYKIENVAGSAKLIDGKNVFVAKAKVNGMSIHFRQGMEGFASTDTGWQPIPWITFHRLYEMARARFWL